MNEDNLRRTNLDTVHLQTCRECSIVFQAKRSDALTCSARCRQRYKRALTQATQHKRQYRKTKRGK